MVYLSGAGLPRLSWNKRLLNGCSSVVAVLCHLINTDLLGFNFVKMHCLQKDLGCVQGDVKCYIITRGLRHQLQPLLLTPDIILI